MRMISLKKYLEQDPDELLSCTLDCYRSALSAVGSYGVLSCSTTGSGLRQSLLEIAKHISREVTCPVMEETREQVKAQLQQWGSRTEDYFKEKTNEVKELLIVLARTAESVGERDQKYASQFTQLTSRLQTIANLEDITQIRTSLVNSAVELKNCVDQMTRDGQESVKQLQAEMSAYQAKLVEAERRASRDGLTDLENRASVESHIEWHIAMNQKFCLVMLDLDDFKQVNDKYGHQAGDDLLKQFASELRTASRREDVVGRWGGDEFVLLLNCDLQEAQARVKRIETWIFGDYTIPLGKETCKLSLSASIGLAEWKPGASMEEVLRQADVSMYEEKAGNRQTK
jgi:diguanylate cyclase (GGDEF)-like protein